jgi:hypothetical protein
MDSYRGFVIFWPDVYFEFKLLQTNEQNRWTHGTGQETNGFYIISMFL